MIKDVNGVRDTELELGVDLYAVAMKVATGQIDKRELARYARTILAAERPEVTREAVHEWVMNRQVGQALEVHVWEALSHFAPPREVRPIDGMSVNQIEVAIETERATKNSHIPCNPDFAEMAARIALRLAQPVPKVDPDAEAKRECWAYFSAAFPDDYKNEKDCWADRTDPQRRGWRAVAAAKGDGA